VPFECPTCSNPLPDGASFCNQCWREVSADGSPPAYSSTEGAPPGAPVFEPPIGGPEPPTVAVSGEYPPAPPELPPSPWAGGPMPPAPYGESPGHPSASTAGYGSPVGFPPPPPPAWGQSPYGQSPYAPAPFAGSQATNGMAIASLVSSLLGLTGVFCGITALGAPLGVVFGHVALSQIKRQGGEGRGLAIAGLVIGYILTALAVVAIVFIIAAIANDSSY